MTTLGSPHSPHAFSFGQAAELYDTIRPTYPSQALRWAFGGSPLDIVDLGAGTGLLSRGLVAAGHRVTAVEPDEKMLGKLTSTTHGLAGCRVGNAEDIPLPDHSADIVTAGQAYHWFDTKRALPQIQRVLRAGGTFCPIWNVRDESADWVKQLSDIVGSSDAEIMAVKLTESLHEDTDCFGPWFSNVALRIFRHEKPLNGDGLLALVKSRSHYLTADDDRKTQIETGVRQLLAEHPQLSGGSFAMPYATYVFRATA